LKWGSSWRSPCGSAGAWVVDLGGGASMPESILAEATRLTEGDRQESYGHPLDNFSKEAALISAAFTHKLRPGVAFEAEDIGLIEILRKVARQTHQRKRDNLVDIAGYASCAHRVEVERAARGRKEKGHGEQPRGGEPAVVVRGREAGNGLRVYGEPGDAPVRRARDDHQEQQGGGGYLAAGLGRAVATPSPKEGCGCRACETRREAKAAGEGVQA